MLAFLFDAAYSPTCKSHRESESQASAGMVPVLHVQGAVLGSGLRRHPAPRFYSFLFASSSNAAFSSQVYTEADEDGHLSMAQEATRHWDWQGLAHAIGWVRTRTLVETWGGS